MRAWLADLHHALRGDRRGPDRPAEHSFGPGLHDARPLLQQRLLEKSSGNPDLAAELQDLLRGQALPDLAIGGLELGGALDDTLEGGPVDAGREAIRHAIPAARRERRRA